MKASELIRHLEALIQAEGDLEVCALIDDYGDSFGVIQSVKSEEFSMVGPQDEYDHRKVFFIS